MESSAVTLQPALDGQLVNAGPFVLREALFKNDLDLTFGDSRLHDYTMLQFLTIFSTVIPCYSLSATFRPICRLSFSQAIKNRRGTEISCVPLPSL